MNGVKTGAMTTLTGVKTGAMTDVCSAVAARD